MEPHPGLRIGLFCIWHRGRVGDFNIVVGVVGSPSTCNSLTSASHRSGIKIYREEWTGLMPLAYSVPA